MGLIAIAVNPASGRDIRRLVSKATVYSNKDKLNTVERIILTACQLGEHHFVLMPEPTRIGLQLARNLEDGLHLIPQGTISTAAYTISESLKDTAKFAAYAESQGASCLIVLGGDGTSRAAAKSDFSIPMIALSTGTNNVFPETAEGTRVGMAAAAIDDGAVDLSTCTYRSKRIEVYKNGIFTDIALVDAVFSRVVYSGSKAIWERNDIERVVVSRCHPSSIGFSSLLGSVCQISPVDDGGAAADCTDGEPNVRTALAAGVITPFRLENVQSVRMDTPISWKMDHAGMIALDGEREVRFDPGDDITIRITRNGPLRVVLDAVLSSAQEHGFFRL
ncbi:MAG: NAD(+)/NADH kinase [Eubacterium sp.]|nr:NAD(+)/NADH kinase [Eubacterium sp.]